jgi:tripeptidyl-peptidase I
MRVSTLLLAVALAAVEASPLLKRSGYAVKEATRLPRKWNRVGSAPLDREMVFSIGLKQSQFEELERQLYQGMFVFISF